MTSIGELRWFSDDVSVSLIAPGIALLILLTVALVSRHPSTRTFTASSLLNRRRKSPTIHASVNSLAGRGSIRNPAGARMEKGCSVATDIMGTISQVSSNKGHRYCQYLAQGMKLGEKEIHAAFGCMLQYLVR